jgi:hypothetical protein
MNRESELISLDEKISACTSHSIGILKDLTSVSHYDKYRKEFKIDEFRQKLVSYKMDEYTDPLYDYMLLECRKNDKDQNNSDRFKENTRQYLVFQEELVMTLRLLLSGGKLYPAINIPREKSKIIKNKTVIGLLTESAVQSLKNEIQRLELNVYPLSIAEAKEAINSMSDLEWIKKWMDSNNSDVDPEYYKSFTLRKFDNYCEKLGITNQFGSKDSLLSNLIDEYAYDHRYSVSLDIEEIDRILKRLKAKKSKRGPKESTANLKYLAFTLSIFKRLDTFLEKPEIETMKQIEIVNEDLRFVHDVMAFFNLIVDRSKNLKTKQGLEPYIRKMIESLNDQESIDEAYLFMRILKFNRPNRC